MLVTTKCLSVILYIFSMPFLLYLIPVWYSIYLDILFSMLCSSKKYCILHVISKWKNNTKGDPWVQRIGQRGWYTTEHTEWEQTTYCTHRKLIKHWCQRLSQPNSSPLLPLLFFPAFFSTSQSSSSSLTILSHLNLNQILNGTSLTWQWWCQMWHYKFIH